MSNNHSECNNDKGGNLFTSTIEQTKSVINRLRSNILWLKEPHKVAAVHSDDIAKLKSIIPVASTKCHYCGKEIAEGKLGGWIKIQNRLVPFCDSGACLPLNNEEKNES